MVTEPVRLAPGERAPAFTLPDENGVQHSLRDYRGKRVILYFYPAALTPGCSAQACDFRDSLGVFQGAGYAVLGVSKDPVAKLAEFRERDALTFPLLSDTALKAHRAYGAWGEKLNYGRRIEGTLRSTFVIDERGRIELARYNVRAKGHVAMLRRLLGL